jgi:CheY-like chemotaxis protein
MRVTGRILVAEDYRTNQEVARRHLEDAGHSVHIVNNGREAVDASIAQTFDLILMDVQMPEMDGLEATRRIRAGTSAGARVPIIALTADVAGVARQACQAAGMDDVLSKPLRRDALLCAVQRWLTCVDREPAAASAGAAPPPPQAGPETVPLDYESVLAVFDDAATVREMVHHLLRDVQRQIEVMRAALARQDWETLRRESHALKGGAGSMEAHPLAAVAARIEQLSQADTVDGMADLLEELIAEHARLEDYAANRVKLSS